MKKLRRLRKSTRERWALYKKELSGTEKESAGYAQQLKEAREEADKLRGELAEQKRQSVDAEQNLGLELIAAQSKAEAKYDWAVIEITENYQAQMTAVKDALWEASWKR